MAARAPCVRDIEERIDLLGHLFAGRAPCASGPGKDAGARRQDAVDAVLTSLAQAIVNLDARLKVIENAPGLLDLHGLIASRVEEGLAQLEARVEEKLKAAGLLGGFAGAPPAGGAASAGGGVIQASEAEASPKAPPASVAVQDPAALRPAGPQGSPRSASWPAPWPARAGACATRALGAVLPEAMHLEAAPKAPAAAEEAKEEENRVFDAVAPSASVAASEAPPPSPCAAQEKCCSDEKAGAQTEVDDESRGAEVGACAYAWSACGAAPFLSGGCAEAADEPPSATTKAAGAEPEADSPAFSLALPLSPRFAPEAFAAPYPDVELRSDAGSLDGPPSPRGPPAAIARALALKPGEDWCLEVGDGDYSESSEWSGSGEPASPGSAKSRWSEGEKIALCTRKCTYFHPLSPTAIYWALTEVDLRSEAPWRATAMEGPSSFRLPIRPRASGEFEEQEGCDVPVFSAPSSSSSDAV